MQVYLPDELYQRVKGRGASLNVSGVLQAALETSLDELERQEALRAAVAEYENLHGTFTDAELNAITRRDHEKAVSTRTRRRSSAA